MTILIQTPISYFYIPMLHLIFFSPLSCAASLIRGNRANCALFCDNLDWLVSKLDRLEASSGILDMVVLHLIALVALFYPGKITPMFVYLHSHIYMTGILEVLYCVLIESPEVLNIIQENHIKSIISLLDKHGRNHKVSKHVTF